MHSQCPVNFRSVNNHKNQTDFSDDNITSYGDITSLRSADKKLKFCKVFIKKIFTVSPHLNRSNYFITIKVWVFF